MDQHFKLGESGPNFMSGPARLPNRSASPFAPHLFKYQSNITPHNSAQQGFQSKRRPLNETKSLYRTANMQDAAIGEESTSKMHLQRTVPRNLGGDFNRTQVAKTIPKLENVEKALNNIASEVTSQMQNKQSDDLALTNSQYEHVAPSQQLLPLRDVPLQHLEIPLNIQKQEIVSHFLHPNFTLFATAQSLHCWDISNNKTFSLLLEGIARIQVLESSNGKAKCNGFAVLDAYLVLAVIDSGELRLLNLFLDDQKFESNQVLTQGHQTITATAWFEKTGRLFYGGLDGQVKELLFQDYRNSVLSIIMSAPRRLGKANHEAESLITQFNPFSRLWVQQCSILQLEIDNQRNMLYALKEVKSSGVKLVDVFDLGIAANQLTKVTTITVQQLRNRLQNFIGFSKEHEFDIQHIIAIPYSQSQQQHLILLTTSGERIYLQFESIQVSMPTDQLIEQLGLQSDIFITSRFASKWVVAGFAKLSNPLDLYQQGLVHSVYNSFFDEHLFHGSSLTEQIQNVCYDPLVGLTYTLGASVYTVSRNVGMYEAAKDQRIRSNTSIRENISMISIASHIKDPRNQKIKPEVILGLKNGMIWRCSKEELELVGAYTKYNTWGRQPLNYKTFSQNILQSQAYIPQVITQVLTTQRLYLITHIRPIDHLVMLLTSRTDHFERFSDTYTLHESCAMLVQILCDTTAKYQVTKRERSMLRQPSQQPSIKINRTMRYQLQGDDLTENLYCFNQYPEVEYQFQNENLKAEACSLLTKFGDLITDSNSMLSVRHQALRTYLVRLIRPVWDLSLVSESGHQLASGQSLFSLVLQKVNDFAMMLRRYDRHFVGSQYPENESARTQQAEEESLLCVQAFITRLQAILKLTQMLSPSLGNLNEVASLKLSDVCSSMKYNQQLRNLLDALILIKDGNQKYRIDEEKFISECLFSKEENNVYQGIRYLEMALTVASEQQRDFIVRGYALLSQDLKQVDLYQVVTLLIKNRFIVAAITMCIQKAQCQIDNVTETENCYNFVLQIVQAIVCSMQQSNKCASDIGKLIYEMIQDHPEDRKNMCLNKIFATPEFQNDKQLQKYLWKYFVSESSLVCEELAKIMNSELIQKVCEETLNAFDVIQKTVAERIIIQLIKANCLDMVIKVVVEICTDVLPTKPLLSIEERLKMCTKVDSQIDNSTDLRECKQALQAQLNCINRLKGVPNADKLELQTKFQSLKDLQAIYIQYKLHDLRLWDLLHVVQGINEQQQMEMAKDLISKHLQSLQPERLKESATEFFDRFFSGRHQKLAVYAMVEVFKLRKLDLVEIEKGVQDWFVLYVIRKAIQQPNQIIQRYSQDGVNLETDSIIVIACIRAWISLLEEIPGLKDQLKQHGLTLDPKLAEIQQFLKAEEVQFEKGFVLTWESVLEKTRSEVKRALEMINPHIILPLPQQQPLRMKSAQMSRTFQAKGQQFY